MDMASAVLAAVTLAVALGASYASNYEESVSARSRRHLTADGNASVLTAGDASVYQLVGSLHRYSLARAERKKLIVLLCQCDRWRIHGFRSSLLTY